MVRIAFREYWEVLSQYLLPQRRRVAWLAVAMLSAIALTLVQPQILRYFVDTARDGTATPKTLLAAAGAFIAIAVIVEAVYLLCVWLSEKVAWAATNGLRADLALHCLQLDMSFHNAHSPGELIERIDGDVSSLAAFFSQLILRVVGSLLLLVGIIVVLCCEDLLIGIAMAIYAAAALAMMVAFRSIAVPAWKRAREASADIFGFIEEHLSGTEDVRANGAEEFVLRRLQGFGGARLRAERHAGLMNVGLVGTFLLTFAAGLSLSLGLGYFLFKSGSISVGTAFMLVAYTERMLFPLIHIAHELQELQKASAAITRIHELTETSPLIPDNGHASLPAGPLRIDFEHVSFAYPDDGVPVLHDVSFSLSPGETLGILGRTGSGKTTLARLLFRLFDPTDGTVRIAGTDAREIPLAELRASVALVTQSVQLFKGTVRDNLTFFNADTSDERINQTIRDTGLDEWFNSSDRTLDSELQSGGAGISAGEAQLLAFTRAYLKDPGIVVLDEASSRLDRHTEACMTEAVDHLLHNRTGILIAHRLATLQRVDKILIVEDGHIVEWGDRRSLGADPRSHFSRLLEAGIEEVLS